MTSTQNPAGACGDTAPTGDPLNAVSYARGVLQVEAATYLGQRDQARGALEFLTAAVTGGQRWEIDAALRRANVTLANLKART